MADSCGIAELKETIEKMNAELIQSHTKIAELNAQVREQEEGQKEMSNLREENAQLASRLKESEEKCRAVQERLELAEQKLAVFSQKPDATAEECLAQRKKKLKLSTPKTRSHPSNPLFICDKEVVIQLERLSDSVVAEMTAGGSAFMPEQVVENASKLYPVEDKIMDSYLLPTCYSNTDIKVILCHYIKDKEIEVDLLYVDYSSDFTIYEQWEEHHKSFIKKIEQDLNLNPFQEFEKFYVFGDREINFINASFIVWLSQQKNNVKILLVPIFGCIYLLHFYEIMENTLKNKNINIELKEDDCYEIRIEYGIDMPKFVEVVRLKIDNIDSYVSEKIPQIIKSSNNYSIIHRNILLGQCSESCKVEDGKDGCEVKQLCEDGDLPFWLRF